MAGHQHGHQHKLETDQKILVAFLLNLGFAILEVVGGLLSGSIAFASDALHDFADAATIAISYILEKKSKRAPDNKYTYGYVRYSVLGGVVATTILVVGAVMIVHEAIERLGEPSELNSGAMIGMSVIGLVVDLISVYATRGKGSINQRAVNLHMIEDVLGWAVMLVGSVVIHLTGWAFIDPVLSILVAGFVLYAAYQNLVEITDLFLEKTPHGIEIEKIRRELMKIEGVSGVHHIHVRSLDGEQIFATLHVVVKKYDAKIKQEVKERLKKYQITHSTVEIELAEEECEGECRRK